MKFHLFIYMGYQRLLLQHLFAIFNDDTLEVVTNFLASEVIHHAISSLNLHVLNSGSTTSNSQQGNTCSSVTRTAKVKYISISCQRIGLCYRIISRCFLTVFCCGDRRGQGQVFVREIGGQIRGGGGEDRRG